MDEFAIDLSQESILRDILIVLGFIIAGIIIHFVLFKLINRVDADWKILDIVKKKLRWPSLFLIILLSVVISLPIVGVETEDGAIRQLLSIAIIIAIAWLLIKAIQITSAVIRGKHELTAEDNLRARKIHTQFKMLERILVFLVVIVALGVALMTFEKIRQIGVSLLASAGIAGIILGFAAQKMIATIVAGIQIALTQPIRIDDVLIVEGEWGRIEEITLTYSVLKIWDKRRLIIPNTFFIENIFQNWTRVSADILGTVYVYTDYRLPVEELRKEQTRLLKDSPHWDGEVDVVQVTDITDKTMEIRALTSAVDSGTAWNLRVYLREKLMEFIQKNYPEYLPLTRIKTDFDDEERSLDTEDSDPHNKRKSPSP